MAQDSDSQTSDEHLLQLAVERELVAKADAKNLLAAANRKGRQALELALEQNLLNPAQGEFLTAIAKPQEFVRGYEILDLIGYGGMGVVFRARQESLDREVALKTIRMSAIDKPAVLGRTELEAQVVAKMRHPNVVAAYDYGVYDGKVYMALELVEGEDLCSVLDREGPRDERTTWALAHQVAAALAYADDRDVMHRDIKPANLLLTEPLPGFSVLPGIPMVKVTDFGLALRADASLDDTRLTAAGATLGTLAYVAPEQVQESTVDRRADIYSLGASVYHMLTGAAPFSESTPMKVLVAKSTGDDSWRKNLPETVSPETRQLFLAMTESDPAERLGDYNRLLARIDQLLQRETPTDLIATTIIQKPTTTSAQPQQQQSLPNIGRNTRLWLGVALLAAIALGIATQWSQPNSRALDSEQLPQWSQATGQQLFFYTGVGLPLQAKSQGLWNEAQGDELESVIAGSSGFLSLPLRSSDGQNLSEPYLFNVNIKPRSAEVVEVHFGREAPQASAPRIVVQLRDSEARLGIKPTAEGVFQPLAEFDPQPLATGDPAPYQTLQIRRWSGGWAVNLNGTALGAVSPVESEETDRVSLFVRGGEAHFGDIYGVPLVAEEQ